MGKFTAVLPATDKIAAPATTVPIGRLLIDDADEIIYANKQARHILGFLADETLPMGQKFLPLVRAAYHCFPTLAWLDWPKRSRATTTRYLIYTPPNGNGHVQLKVEINEHIRLQGRDIWVITIYPVESKLTPVVPYLKLTI